MNEYTELLQYQPWVEIDKISQEKLVRRSANNDKYAVRIKILHI